MNKKLTYILSACAILLAACTSQPAKKTAEPLRSAAFSADSAYRYIADQVAFGARVPGTDAHRECAAYLTAQLKRFGAEVSTQQGALINYAGENQQIVNIIGHYGPTDKPAILLCAHWDCRPWADQEEEYAQRMTPVLGANDGASGVGVLLEIARQLGQFSQEQTSATNQDQSSTSLPAIDIIFFDAEDMGTPDFYTGPQREDTWCLGSQLWSKNQSATHSQSQNQGQSHTYGILLDMVGAPDAVFPREYFSMKYASAYVDKLWKTAAALGYARFFINDASYPLTDDHYYVNTIAGIPCLDIVHYDQRSGTGFAEYWHTNHDDMKNVSTVTLDAVGKTVLTTILGR